MNHNYKMWELKQFLDFINVLNQLWCMYEHISGPKINYFAVHYGRN